MQDDGGSATAAQTAEGETGLQLMEQNLGLKRLSFPSVI